MDSQIPMTPCMNRSSILVYYSGLAAIQVQWKWRIAKAKLCETSAHMIFPAGDADVAERYVDDTCFVLSGARGERLLLLCSDIIIMRCELNVM